MHLGHSNIKVHLASTGNVYYIIARCREPRCDWEAEFDMSVGERDFSELVQAVVWHRGETMEEESVPATTPMNAVSAYPQFDQELETRRGMMGKVRTYPVRHIVVGPEEAQTDPHVD